MRTYCFVLLVIAQTVLGRGPTDTAVPKVVFIKGTEVFSVSADGADLKQLSSDGRAKWLPRWSPDGMRVAYVASTTAAMAQFTLVAAGGEKLAEFPIRPKGIFTLGMRFIEDLAWLDGTRVLFGGSANPRNCEQVVLDATTGKEVEWQFGICRTFARSPDGKLTAYWVGDGMGYSAEERRENLEINGAVVYPVFVRRKGNALQFLSKPAWSADSQQVALVDHDVNTDVTSLTVLDGRPDRATERRGPDGVVRWAPVLMHVPLAPDLNKRMEVQWVGHCFVVGTEGSEALYQADPVRRTIQPASADALQPLAARRAQAAQLKNKAGELVKKLGGRDDFDIWTAPDATAPTD